jgi:hypothetical protein
MIRFSRLGGKMRSWEADHDVEGETCAGAVRVQ